MLRPLIIVKDGRSLITDEIIEKIQKKFLSWTDLLHTGILELVDANEEENCYVDIAPDVIDPSHTHLEVFPSSILGVGASIIRLLNTTNLHEIPTRVQWQNRVLDSQPR